LIDHTAALDKTVVAICARTTFQPWVMVKN